MTIFFCFSLGILAISLALSVYALFRGPGVLNRTVALDMVTAVTVGVLCLVTVYYERDDTIPILIVLTLIAFLTSTSVARIVGQRSAVVSADPAITTLEAEISQEGQKAGRTAKHTDNELAEYTDNELAEYSDNELAEQTLNNPESDPQPANAVRSDRSNDAK